MSNNTFVLGSGQAHELEMGFRKTGWNNAEVKTLCTGDKLALVKDLINDKLEFKYKQPPVKFPTWKTVKIGNYKSKKDLWKALEDGGFKVDGDATQLVAELSLAKMETEIELVKITSGELGFKKLFELHDVYARAAQLGLDLLPAEVGLQLRLQYPDQPYDEDLYVGMEVMLCYVHECEVHRVVFVVGRDIRGKEITVDSPSGKLSANSFWLFGRRKY